MLKLNHSQLQNFSGCALPSGGSRGQGYLSRLFEDDDRKSEIAALASYIENNFDGLYDSRSLKDRVELKRVLVSPSGAMEKNIDVVVCCRFEMHGMSWIKKGQIVCLN